MYKFPKQNGLIIIIIITTANINNAIRFGKYQTKKVLIYISYLKLQSLFQ